MNGCLYQDEASCLVWWFKTDFIVFRRSFYLFLEDEGQRFLTFLLSKQVSPTYFFSPWTHSSLTLRSLLCPQPPPVCGLVPVATQLHCLWPDKQQQLVPIVLCHCERVSVCACVLLLRHQTHTSPVICLHLLKSKGKNK